MCGGNIMKRFQKCAVMAFISMLVIPIFIQTGIAWSTNLGTISFGTPTVSFNTDGDAGTCLDLPNMFDTSMSTFCQIDVEDYYPYDPWDWFKVLYQHINDFCSIEFDISARSGSSNGIFELFMSGTWSNTIYWYSDWRSYHAEVIIELTGETNASYTMSNLVDLKATVNLDAGWTNSDPANMQIV
jgi:hypothetical protein